MTSSKPILKLGIVGLGGAARHLIPSADQHPGIEVVAAADVDQEGLARFESEHGGLVYSSIQELCSNEEIDAVYIATPNQFHVEHALVALANDKHLLLEKPMALSLEESDSIIEEAERRGRTLVVSSPHSFAPATRAILRMLRDGELGTLRTIHCWLYGSWIYQPRTADEMNPEPGYGGGVVFRQGPHQFDIIRTIAGGMVDRVSGSVGTWDHERPVPGSFVASLFFENGVAATAVHSGYDHFQTKEFTQGRSAPPAPEVYGRSRRNLKGIQERDEESSMKRSGGYGASGPATVGKTYPSPFDSMLLIVTGDRADVRLTPDGLIYYGHDEVREMHIPPENAYLGLVSELYDSIVHGIEPSHDGRWAKATLEVCLGVIESDKQQREIRLEHQRPMPPLSEALAIIAE